MHDPFGMQVGECFEQLSRKRSDDSLANWFTLDELALECAALHQLHDQVDVLVALVDFFELYNLWVGDVSQDADFAKRRL